MIFYMSIEFTDEICKQKETVRANSRTAHTNKDWQVVLTQVDKVEKRLAGRKIKVLPRRDRFALVNSIIGASPRYIACPFYLLADLLLKEVNTIRTGCS